MGLYSLVRDDEAFTQAHRHAMIGVLLGYDANAIHEFAEGVLWDGQRT